MGWRKRTPNRFGAKIFPLFYVELSNSNLPLMALELLSPALVILFSTHDWTCQMIEIKAKKLFLL